MKAWVCAGVAIAAAWLSAAPAAADCVDFSQARADRAAAALSRNPPSAQTIGMPTLEGLALDASRTAGDPECNGPPTRFYYTTNLTTTQLIAQLYPNIRRRTDTDGMNRVWFKNPNLGDRIFITTGTEVHINANSQGAIQLLTIDPPDALAPLSAESQPYAVDDIVAGIPWPGGGREFVRADGGQQQAASSTESASQTPASSQTANCPPASASGATNGASAGAQIGSALGGGRAGAAAGAVLGGILGGRRQQPQQAPATPACR